jgi:hypothetical protein
MPVAGPQTRFAALRKFSARRGAPFVNATGNLRAKFTGERRTAGGSVVSASHAASLTRHIHGQPNGYLTALVHSFRH